jgi:hypothetical protein
VAHDVFVSYPNVDKATADAVVNSLESSGIRCWVAPRDVPHGVDWAAAIVDAIDHSPMMVLVFSDGTNASDHILREVRAAGDADIPIVPFRTTQAEPNKALKYYIGGTHWLDAITGPMEGHLQTLAATVSQMLSADGPVEWPVPARSLSAHGESGLSWWSRLPVGGKLGAGAAAALLLVGGIALLRADDPAADDSGGAAGSDSSVTSIEPAATTVTATTQSESSETAAGSPIDSGGSDASGTLFAFANREGPNPL